MAYQNQQPEVISSGTAIISDENGVPTKVHLSDKEKLTEMTETHDLRNQWYDEPVQYETSEKVIKDIEAQIKLLQSKLEFYKELEQTKTPCEEAYKDAYGKYPVKEISENLTSEDNWNVVSWSAFQKGYNAAYQEKVAQEPEEEPEELKTLYQMLYDDELPVAQCKIICEFVKKWMSQYTHNVMTGEYLKGYEECLTVLEENLK